MENSENILPNQTKLLTKASIPQENYFKSEIIEREVLPIQNNIENENKLIYELKEMFRCCICLGELENPLNDPICPHYACKTCLDHYFASKGENIVPCPLCRRRIRKKNLVKVPLIEKVQNIIKASKDSYDIGFEIENCDKHPNNKFFYICVDCNAKMCPICEDEKKKHTKKKHHIVNYERFLKLYNIFKNNFQCIKKSISDYELNIKELKELVSMLQQQKNSYLDLFNSISIKFEKIYLENENNINKKINEYLQKIANLKNIMKNIKLSISSQFNENYNEIDNIDEIEKEIKEREKKLNLKKINKDEIKEIKTKYFNTAILINTKNETITLKKSELINNLNETTILDNEGYYTFGVGLSDDKKRAIIYLRVDKVMGKKQNESSYSVKIEYNNILKKFYLEKYPDENYYSYEINMPIEELFIENKEKIDIKVNILSISIIEKSKS